MNNDASKELSRREAIAKLAKLSAYTAPTVTALLVSSTSYAAGSCPGTIVDTIAVEISTADMGGRRDRTDMTVTVGDGSVNMLAPNMDTPFDCSV